MFGLGTSELVILGIVAILLFGKNLPDVARKFGKTYREFRRGLSDLQSTVNLNEVMDTAPSRPAPKRSYSDYDDYDDVSAPKFEPPPAPPSATSANQDAA
jgi:sec-independent protein translocase protein TatA